MDKTDRRIRRTRRLLGEALIELLQSRSFDALTIRDITDTADIGYATFFRHYSGKEELLSEQLALIIRDLESRAGDRGEEYFRREGTRFFEYIGENELLFRGFLGRHAGSEVRRTLKDTLSNIIRPYVERHIKGVELRVPVEIAINHIAAAALELAAWWLENNQPYLPNDMGVYYERLVIQATWNAIMPGGAADHLVMPGR